MKTSRQQLLEYVQQHRVVTAEELSRALHMTQANVRRHLDILIEQSLVEVTGNRPSDGRGRPARFFSPSEKSLGDNLALLSSVLLQEVNLVTSPESKETFLKHVAERLLLHISSQIGVNQGDLIIQNGNPGKGDQERVEADNPQAKSGKGVVTSLNQRLFRGILDLNRFHYHARWEAHVDSPLLILGYCPYLSVQTIHPELCQIDAFLLVGLLQTNVEQIAKLVKDRRGVTSCIFRVHSKQT